MPRPSRFDDVVEAAAIQFREKGYHACSLDDIAAEVGLWKGSIYHYIDTKADLLLAVVSVPADRLLSSLREIADADLPPSEKIRAIVTNHIEVLDENFAYASVYLEEIAGRHLDEGWAAKDREYIRLVERVVADGVADGSFQPSLDPRIATFSLVGSLNWLIRWYRPEGEMGSAEIAAQISSVVLTGILRRTATVHPSEQEPPLAISGSEAVASPPR
jgi:AcrR family transcriptional regulator